MTLRYRIIGLCRRSRQLPRSRLPSDKYPFLYTCPEMSDVTMCDVFRAMLPALGFGVRRKHSQVVDLSQVEMYAHHATSRWMLQT
jgi:hypothetical protein